MFIKTILVTFIAVESLQTKVVGMPVQFKFQQISTTSTDNFVSE